MHTNTSATQGLGLTVTSARNPCKTCPRPRPRAIMEPRGRLLFRKVNPAVLACLMRSVTLLQLANASAGLSSRLILCTTMFSDLMRVFTSTCFTLPAPFRMGIPFPADASRHRERDHFSCGKSSVTGCSRVKCCNLCLPCTDKPPLKLRRVSCSPIRICIQCQFLNRFLESKIVS